MEGVEEALHRVADNLYNICEELKGLRNDFNNMDKCIEEFFKGGKEDGTDEFAED